ncbi:MAG: hypothetical protein K2Q18_01905 [Bdellovibrionales bacterium]|nr:hypothetical protein [Bdellovibrionales bacterium]
MFHSLFTVILSIALFANTSIAEAGMGGNRCGSSCLAMMGQYYGPTYGGNGFYPYSSLPFHSLYGPSPYYFQPYAPSPYQPQDCFVCMQRYNMYTSPISSPGITKNGVVAPLFVQLND